MQILSRFGAGSSCDAASCSPNLAKLACKSGPRRFCYLTHTQTAQHLLPLTHLPQGVFHVKTDKNNSEGFKFKPLWLFFPRRRTTRQSMKSVIRKSFRRAQTNASWDFLLASLLTKLNKEEEVGRCFFRCSMVVFYCSAKVPKIQSVSKRICSDSPRFCQGGSSGGEMKGKLCN